MQNVHQKRPTGWLESVLRGDFENRFGKFLSDPEKYRFQVLIAVPSHLVCDSVASMEGNGGSFYRFGFRAGAEYIYPASCIKLAAAMATLAFLRDFRKKWDVPVGICSSLAFHRPAEAFTIADQSCTPLGAERDASELKCAINTSAAADKPLLIESRDASNVSGPSCGRITVAHEIRKMCLVSDNPAYNRLADLVGDAYINDYLVKRLGLTSACLKHRLYDQAPTHSLSSNDSTCPSVEIWYSKDGGLCLPRKRWNRGISSSQDNNAGVAQQRTSDFLTETSTFPVPERKGLLVGQSYIDQSGLKVDEPMDFATKNSMSLQDLQDLLMTLARPDLICSSKTAASTSNPGHPAYGSGIDDGDRLWLMEAMAQFPGQSCNPCYDCTLFPDDYAKFFHGGVCRVWDKRAVRVFNKDGQAYGFSTDNAYVMNVDTGENFFLAASVYTNDNGTLNDDCYGYSEAESLMEDLAEVVTRALFRSR